MQEVVKSYFTERRVKMKLKKLKKLVAFSVAVTLCCQSVAVYAAEGETNLGAGTANAGGVK